MAEEQRKQEIREALGAGARALTSLREAKEKLESALLVLFFWRFSWLFYYTYCMSNFK